jgi:hypothetical protein
MMDPGFCERPPCKCMTILSCTTDDWSISDHVRAGNWIEMESSLSAMYGVMSNYVASTSASYTHIPSARTYYLYFIVNGYAK